MTQCIEKLIGKLYSHPKTPTKSTSSAAVTPSTSCEEQIIVHCYCQRPESGAMVMCNNPMCSYGWFHFDCLKLTAPHGAKPAFILNVEVLCAKENSSVMMNLFFVLQLHYVRVLLKTYN